MKFIFFLVRKFLRTQSGEGSQKSIWPMVFVGIFFATMGVFLGIGILGGFQDTYRRAILDFNSHVVLTREGGFGLAESESVISILNRENKSTPLVWSAYAFYETLMPTTKGLKSVILKGVDAKKMRQLYPFEFHHFDARDGEALAQNPVLAGSGILDLQPSAQTAQSLRFLTLRDSRGQETTRFASLSLTGSFRSGLYQYDSQFVLLDIQDLQKKYLEKKSVSGFEIRLADTQKIDALAESLRRDLPYAVQVTTWEELNGSLLESLRLERTTFFIIVFLILAIASLNVFGFNFLFFLGRKREFQILTLLGMDRKVSGRLLQTISFMIGVTATLASSLAAWMVLLVLKSGRGVALDPTVYFVDRLPIRIEEWWFACVIIGTWILCVVASSLAGRVILKKHLNPGELTR